MITHDKDKEAFEKFVFDKEFPEGIHENVQFEPHQILRETWQAACEYKDKEIDEMHNLLEQVGFNYDGINYKEEHKGLQAENKKLREALNYYANKYCWNGTHIGPSDYWFDDKQGYFLGGLRAREALKEIDEKL